MKANSISSRLQMDNATKQYLVAEVKETIAFDIDFAKTEKGSLKSVDLWKMEKSKKYATKTFSRKRNVIPFM
jgi:hypothetical protein